MWPEAHPNSRSTACSDQPHFRRSSRYRSLHQLPCVSCCASVALFPASIALTTGRADAPRRHSEPTHRPMHSNLAHARAPSSNYTNSTPRLAATPRPIAQTPRPVQTPRLLSECPIGDPEGKADLRRGRGERGNQKASAAERDR